MHEKEEAEEFPIEEEAKDVNKEELKEDNPFVGFLKHMSEEYGILLSVILMLPLILMALYILIIEQAPLYVGSFTKSELSEL